MYWLIIPVTVYSIGLLSLWLILQKRHDVTVPATSTPVKISVVVACRNEEDTIVTLLKSLAEQDYPHDLLEIVITNDGSTDRTPIVVSRFIADLRQHSSLNVRLIYNPFSGKKSAIRHAIDKLDGELILTTDADCVTGPGWVSTYVGYYAATGADMIVGRVYQRRAAGFVSQFGRLEFAALQTVTGAAVAAGHPVMCNAANMAIRRDVYLRHKDELRYDIPSGDDIFLMHAVGRAGGRIAYLGSEMAAVVTAPAVTPASLLRQRTRWASKTLFYRDAATLTVAAATAACNAAVAAAAVASLITLNYLPLLGLLYAIRLIPDFLIIRHDIKKRERHMSLLSFLLSELLYPFYFCTVAVMSLFPSSRRFAPRS